MITRYFIFAAALILASCSGQQAAQQPQPQDAAAYSRVLDSLNTVYRAKVDSLTARYEHRANAAAATQYHDTAAAPEGYQGQAAERAKDSAPTTAQGTKICPEFYTPKKGAQAGQPQPVKQGSRGGCYYLNASGNKTYLH